jgi:transcriptional regulator NrdR family protein
MNNKSKRYASKHFFIDGFPAPMKQCDVIDSRPFGNYIKRRRVDSLTGKRYTTYEIYSAELETLIDDHEAMKLFKNMTPLVTQLKKVIDDNIVRASSLLDHDDKIDFSKFKAKEATKQKMPASKYVSEEILNVKDDKLLKRLRQFNYKG